MTYKKYISDRGLCFQGSLDKYFEERSSYNQIKVQIKLV